MNIDHKITIWERLQIDDSHQAALLDFLNDNPTATSDEVNEFVKEHLDEDPYRELLDETGESLTPQDNDGEATLEVTKEKGEVLWSNAPHSDVDEQATYALHSQLCTRDGRIVGNGIVRALKRDSEGATLFEVETDFGNVTTYTYAEISSRYYAPTVVHKLQRWRADREVLTATLHDPSSEALDMQIRQRIHVTEVLMLPSRLRGIVEARIAGDSGVTLQEIYAACADSPLCATVPTGICWESEYDEDTSEYQKGTIEVVINDEVVLTNY